MNVYIASPFFTPDQLKWVERIENLLTEIGIEFYSPRKDGVLQDMNREQQQYAMRKIFALNCNRLDWCDTVLALMDWKDAGVVWELGYSFRALKRIITFTSANEKVNVMLKECASLHVNGYELLEEVLRSYQAGGRPKIHPDTREVY